MIAVHPKQEGRKNPMKSVLIRVALACALVVLAAQPVLGGSTRQTSRPSAAHAVPNFNTPAAQLRITVNRTLAEHAFLLGEAMRAGLGSGEGFEAAGDALEENTTQLVGLIEEVYGAPAGDRFGELWRSHVAYLIDYTRALEADDESAQDLAQQQLHEYVTDFSSFLAGANPNLPEAALKELVGEHVEQLESIAAYDAGDYSKAYPAIRRTYGHMFAIGDGLSEAIALQFPEIFKGKSLAFSPAGDLRLSLDQLLGEHTVLAVTAMRAGVSDAADQDAARDALDANTNALAAAVGSIYGNPAGEAFVDVWSIHTDAYLDYVTSTLDGDTAGQAAAIDQLAEYRTEFSDFLADANPELSAAALRDLLEHHTAQLVDQVDAFAAGDYELAYAVAREAFAHSFEIGDALALAIAAQFPDMFPDTGLPAPGERPWLLAAWLIVLLASALVLIRRRATG
jgi:hypothetical protein